MAINKTILVAILGLLAAASPALAQGWGQGSLPRDGACFYSDTNFRGDYFCLGAGDDLNSVPRGTNDRISSLKLFGRVGVTVFKDARFSGRSTRFDGDVRNLKDEGWNDAISSIRVGQLSGGRQYGQYGQYGRTENPDAIVRRAYQDILNREPDSAGLRLYRSRIIDDGWTEGEVREALRKSPENREKNAMSYARAEETVRRAYQSVLNREPDAGSRGYVEKVFRDRWSQQDVERELRRSREYRTGQ